MMRFGDRAAVNRFLDEIHIALKKNGLFVCEVRNAKKSAKTISTNS